MKKFVVFLLSITTLISLVSCTTNDTILSSSSTANLSCINCNSAISITDKFCSNCGTEVTNATTDSKDTLTNDITSVDNIESKPQSSSESLSKEDKPTENNPTENNPTVIAGEYTVTFDYGYDNKKTTAKSQNYKVAKPEDPVRNGYKFMGWYTANESEQWNFTGHAVTADMTLTAKWGKYGYYLSYSTVVNGIETIVLKEQIGISPDIVSSGTDTTTYERGVYALFSPYSVAIDGDSIINPAAISNLNISGYDSHSFKVPFCFTVDSETFTVPELTFDNLEFLGWTYDGQTTPVKTVTIPKGTTKGYHLIANWKSK